MSSRRVDFMGATYTVGVLVQCNYNWDGHNLHLGGRDVGDRIRGGRHCFADRSIPRHATWYPYCEEGEADETTEAGRDGSIIIVVATDAPLLPNQLGRVAKRPSLAIGRLGGVSEDGSGDIFVAFSTANEGQVSEDDFSTVAAFPNNGLTAIFTATVQATEEAIVNAMVAAETVIGASGFRVEELPEAEVRAIFE